MVEEVNHGNFDVGERILVPYLLDRQILKLDYIVVSHFDTDHVGGLLTVMDELKVDTVVISRQGVTCENYERFIKIVKEKRIKVVVVEKGDRLKIENDLYFDILWPNNSNLINENVLNNNSIVCKLQYKKFSMLFTGDIEEIAEKKIWDIYKDKNVLNATVLKVAHHGSKTSSIQKFIEEVNPKVALIGVGQDNTFGHPNSEVLQRLQNIRKQNM